MTTNKDCLIYMRTSSMTNLPYLCDKSETKVRQKV